MKIAVVGAGFAGLAACWHLLQNQSHQITLLDGNSPAASAMSAGLLHPFTGADARLARDGYQAMEAARALIAVAENALGQPVAVHSGVIRLALTERQRESFSSRCGQYSDLRWLETSQIQTLLPAVTPAPGLLIPQGVAVYPERYIKGLWMACQSRGALRESRTITSLRELDEFDRIVITAGAGTGTIKELAPLPLRLIKGQILELEWPSHLPPLALPVISDAYLVMTSDNRRCIVGATFEKAYGTEGVEEGVAEAILRPKAEAIVPGLGGARLLECRAGIRATTKTHAPLVYDYSERVKIFTAFGSKGLLYHAYLSNSYLSCFMSR